MTTPVDVCNMALSEVGSARGKTISALTDGSQAAVQCSIWYDTLRRRLLRTAPWAFARRQVVLTLLGDLSPDQTSPYPWAFKYEYPPDCLRVRYILAPPFPTVDPTLTPIVGDTVASTFLGPSRQWRFLVHNDVDPDGNDAKVLLTNVQQASCVYTGDVTNPDRWDELFLGALATALASKLVIPLSGNVGERATMEALVDKAILAARTADGNESITKSDVQVDWIQARGAGSPFGFNPANAGMLSQWGNCFTPYDDFNWSM